MNIPINGVSPNNIHSDHSVLSFPITESAHMKMMVSIAYISIPVILQSYKQITPNTRKKI